MNHEMPMQSHEMQQDVRGLELVQDFLLHRSSTEKTLQGREPLLRLAAGLRLQYIATHPDISEQRVMKADMIAGIVSQRIEQELANRVTITGKKEAEKAIEAKKIDLVRKILASPKVLQSFYELATSEIEDRINKRIVAEDRDQKRARAA